MANKLVNIKPKTKDGHRFGAIRGLHVVRGDWLLENNNKRPRAGDNPLMEYVADYVPISRDSLEFFVVIVRHRRTARGRTVDDGFRCRLCWAQTTSRSMKMLKHAPDCPLHVLLPVTAIKRKQRA